MLGFLIRRIIQAIIVMLAVALIAFMMFRFMGDPVSSMVPEHATEQERAEVRERLGLDQPLFVQYGRFVARAATGDFGLSWRNARPVSTLLAERFPATAELVLVAAALSLVVGIPLGIYTALRPNSFNAQMLQFLSLVGISLPTFVTGILLILVFSVWLGWLPSFGRGEVVDIGWWSTGFITASGLKALILPSIMLCLFQLTLIMRLVRAEMMEVLRTDYIKFARARGLRDRAINFRHALRNTLIPVITIFGLQLGGLIAFAIITETVFQWPGMGALFIQAVNFGDVPVMAAYLVLVSFIFVVINTSVDLLYASIDPRLRVDDAGPAGGGH
ncbi:ABC transporter permease [Roseinatronobacter bogoriensis]|uniref:ABC transporter permease n=1 Tax=Roseinatronobacter bogoriensis subsp. barguzinensis TaxID=441209 RepID=A0A2K8KDF7_9RHOB|nr:MULTISPECIES: ABC transporter permease [Rhodobaca]ATX67487.1 ABC transporter permease [Rhodobaca barguzinensis]MBB4207076.1 peptide/nickel transport system permease protein [Rhodobaca bogoriensis DSM 18756]TDW35993.1 peptide/nickel transport system permease protein [Rhodobaca barguzinensis]TDY74006.1 peptide/nickel transport system permease protein [Rhodobaca bogoriensis DSM 18756]